MSRFCTWLPCPSKRRITWSRRCCRSWNTTLFKNDPETAGRRRCDKGEKLPPPRSFLGASAVLTRTFVAKLIWFSTCNKPDTRASPRTFADTLSKWEPSRIRITVRPADSRWVRNASPEVGYRRNGQNSVPSQRTNPSIQQRLNTEYNTRPADRENGIKQ